MRARSRPQAPDWSQLLVDAVTKPGTLSSAYQQFWNYSTGNQLLAWFACLVRGLEPGPINTFQGWLKLGRHVKKGERAITLCMPVDVKRKRRSQSKSKTRSKSVPDEEQDSGTLGTVTVFVFKPRWFVLSQTEGDAYIPTELPQWSEERALTALSIERVSFSHMNGNCQGFARGRQVAVSPLAHSPHSTLFHEIGHVILGHTQEGMLIDHDRTPKSLREAEAESVALICCESLNLPGAAECRGYIQHWLSGETIPEKSALKIFKAADTVLKAGRPNSPKPEHRGRRKTVA